MLLLPLLLAAVAKHDARNEQTICDGLIFHDVYHDQHILLKNLGRPNNLVMHRFTGTLFFSQTIQRGTDVDFVIMACQIYEKNAPCQEIMGVAGGYAIAYDEGNDDIYFGGHNGIYKYNFLKKSAEFFAEEGKSIWGLFIQKNFYYIEYPTQKLYVYQNERFMQVAEAMNIEIDNFFISKKGEVYLSNKTALYKVEKMSKYIVMIDDEVAVRQIIDDSYGDVYFCGADGVYLEDKPYNRIKKIADINKAFGMTFDEKDNVIYSDERAIYALRPSNKSEICFVNSDIEYRDALDLLRGYIVD
ncbi:ommochrome-binding protein-like [Colias croceus]|uniref:ommochrome-binding protein-like n=1 Tax=Colias crocea TaxID=72248 RepID=UPI001E281207|nr:ommochrome-binding protein-like [Colias croceus]